MGSRLITVGTVLAGAVLLVACTSAAPSPADTIRIGTYQTTDLLPIYVMAQEGIAARYGFTVEESEPYGGGLAVAQAVAKDEVDVAYPGVVPLLVLAGDGVVPADIAVVGVNSVANPAHRAGAVLAAPEVRTWGDLTGRQIATHNPTSASAASFGARAVTEGVGSYEFVVVAFPDMGLAVRDGVVAAALMDEPWVTQSLLRGDGHVLGYLQGEPPLDHVPITAIVARSEVLAQPDRLRAFLRAHLEAVAFIRDHPERARPLLVAKLGVSEEVARAMDLKDWPADARLDLDSLGRMEEVMVQAGALEQAADLGTFYDPSILESVLAGG